MTEPTPVRRGFAQPPAVLVLVAALVALAGVGMSVAGALTTGISSDEPAHVTRLESYLNRGGFYAKPHEIMRAEGGHPDNAYVNGPDQAYVYGPVTALMMHGANEAMGYDEAGLVTRTAPGYAVRHVVVALIGAIGLLATAGIAWLLLGNWRWGVVAAGALAAVPMWTGHSMFNPKDVSVATGHTVATLGLVLMASERPTRRRLLGAAAVVTAGLVLTLGTRPGMWVSIGASVIVFVAALAWSRTLKLGHLVALACIFAGSYGALLAVYPRVFSHPLTMLWKSATASADFDHRPNTLGREYVFVHMAKEWPLILLGLFVVGLVAVAMLAARRLQVRSARLAGLALVASQAIALTALIIAKDSNLYNGLRQILFALPAQIVIATIGLAALLTIATRRSARIALLAIAAAGLILPTAAQAAMFPYQYTSINTAASFIGAHNDVDYWDTSYRAFLPDVDENTKLVCVHQQVTRGLDNQLKDCRVKMSGTFSTFWRGSDRVAWSDPRADEVDALMRGTVRIPERCHTIHAVDRWQNFHTVTIARMLRCRVTPAADEGEQRHPSANPWDPNWKG